MNLAWSRADDRRLNALILDARNEHSAISDPLIYMHQWRPTFLTERRHFPGTPIRYPHPYLRGRQLAARPARRLP